MIIVNPGAAPKTPHGLHLDTSNFMCKEGRMILEQFTGLTDKNGVEIYEGDIVSRENNCMYSDGRSNDEVIFIHDAFCVNGCSLFGCINSFDAEVIGNIHQSPELLEK
jgi:hypothetical protein